ERLLLDHRVLGDRLDDEVDAPQVLDPERSRQARLRGVALLGRKAPLVDEAIETPVDVLEPAVQKALVRLDDRGLIPRLGHDLGDTAAHEPAPDDADLRDR